MDGGPSAPYSRAAAAVNARLDQNGGSNRARRIASWPIIGKGESGHEQARNAAGLRRQPQRSGQRLRPLGTGAEGADPAGVGGLQRLVLERAHPVGGHGGPSRRRGRELRGRRRPGGRVAHGGAVPRGERLRHAGDHAGGPGPRGPRHRRLSPRAARRYLLDALANPPADGTAAAIWIGANDYNALLLDASLELVRRRSRRWSATPSWRRGRSRRPGSSGSSSTTCRRRSSCRCRCRRSSPRWSTGTTRHSRRGCVPGEPGDRRGDRRHAPHRRRRSSPTRAPSG